jgi:NADH pyrophosphatase NudC (nudix superfamily)
MKYCPLCRTELRTQESEESPRLGCPSPDCEFVHWNNPVPVAAGLVRWNGQYVLARNTRWPEGRFSMITGFIETGESPEEAILRELEEELGLRATEAELIGHFPLPRLNQLIIAYSPIAHGTIELNYELAEFRIVPPAELAAVDFGPFVLTRRVVDEWLAMTARQETRSAQANPMHRR